MNLYQLYYFRTTAKLEHYTKAATQLAITQPSLSHAISALEDELGTRLFEKQGRNVVLTENGKLFLTYVEKALNELEAGEKKIKELNGNIQHSINMGFIYTLSSHFVPNLIAGFKRDKNWSDIEFHLKEGTSQHECSADLIKSLKHGKLDLIFISLLPKKDPDIEYIPICEQNLVLLASKDFAPLASAGTIDLRTLVNQPLIYYSGKSGLKQEIDRLFASVNVVPKINCEVEDETTMCELVSANVGVAIIPYNPNFQKFNVKILPITNPNYTRRIYMGYMKNRQDTVPIQNFKSYIRDRADDLMQTYSTGRTIIPQDTDFSSDCNISCSANYSPACNNIVNL